MHSELKILKMNMKNIIWIFPWWFFMTIFVNKYLLTMAIFILINGEIIFYKMITSSIQFSITRRTIMKSLSILVAIITFIATIIIIFSSIYWNGLLPVEIFSIDYDGVGLFTVFGFLVIYYFSITSLACTLGILNYKYGNRLWGVLSILFILFSLIQIGNISSEGFFGLLLESLRLILDSLNNSVYITGFMGLVALLLNRYLLLNLDIR